MLVRDLVVQLASVATRRSVPGDFNPYREWLGLQAAQPPNHYELLSLPLFETDIQRIAAAAERATTKVRGFRPGPHAGAWSQLLDQIVAAKACLSDRESRAAYDRALRAGTPGTIAAAESRAASPASALAPLQGELYPPGMGPPQGASNLHLESSGSEASGPVLHVAQQARPEWSDLDPPGQTPRAAPAHVASSAMLAVPADVDPMAPVTPAGAGLPASSSATQKSVPMDAIVLSDAGGSPFALHGANDSRIGARRHHSVVGLLVVGLGGGFFLAALVLGYVFIRHHHFRPAEADVAEDIGDATSSPAVSPPADVTPSPPATPPNAAPPPGPQSKLSPVTQTPEPAPLPTTPAASAPLPEQSPVVKLADVQALIKALDSAKAALGEQNFATAEQELAKATSLARLPKHQAAVARLKEVSEYVKQFRLAVAAAVQGLEPGESFQVGTSTEVAFVSGSADEVTLRIAGMNRKFALNGLPAQLALELSNFKLDATSPLSRIVKGAYLVVHRQPDDELKQKELERAQALWEEAAEAGADIEHLMPFLADNYGDFVKDATADGK